MWGRNNSNCKLQARWVSDIRWDPGKGPTATVFKTNSLGCKSLSASKLECT